MVDQCVHNPFNNRQQQPRYPQANQYGSQYATYNAGAAAPSHPGRVSAINAAEHPNLYDLPNF